MVNFDQLVNGPVVKTFGTGSDSMFTPAKSQPGEPAYPVAGVFSRTNELIETEDFAHSSSVPTLSVRVAEFAVTPVQFDLVSVPNEGDFVIFDLLIESADGGMIVLILRDQDG